MTRINLETDLQPLSEFRANASSIIDKVKNENRTIIITQHGKGAAVLISVSEYERLIDKIELLEDIATSKAQFEAGLVRDHDEVMKELREQIQSKGNA
jgi:prevent-host-death family protein